MKHSLTCNAPICACDTNPNFKKEVIWMPGEEVCGHVPYTKFQKKQIDINKWFAKGKFKDVVDGWNAHQLETRSI